MRLLLAQARRGAFAGMPGGLPGARLGAVRVMAHGYVCDDALGAVAVLRDHVGREPETRFLLDGIDGNGVRVMAVLVVVVALLQCDACSWARPRAARCIGAMHAAQCGDRSPLLWASVGAGARRRRGIWREVDHACASRGAGVPGEGTGDRRGADQPLVGKG